MLSVIEILNGKIVIKVTPKKQQEVPSKSMHHINSHVITNRERLGHLIFIDRNIQYVVQRVTKFNNN